MSETILPPIPPSPGVGTRRKGPNSLPRLPPSAFSPPNTGTSETFPLAPSPSAVHPDHVIDGHVLLSTNGTSLDQWKAEVGQALGGKIGALVVYLNGTDAEIESAISRLGSNNDLPILSVIVPFSLAGPAPTTAPSYLSESTFPISYATVFTEPIPDAIANLRWALQQGTPVDIEFRSVMSDVALEGFEDLLAKATTDPSSVSPIIISNILPPPHDLTLPIVKLLNHPTYRAFQTQTAALSLFPRTYVKFLPPSWNVPTPSTFSPGSASIESEEKLKREWKRRIKMYLGPVLEAFGYQRIIFGSSPSPTSQQPSNAGDWYEIARESFAELGVEQDQVDAVFFENAKTVYGKK